MKDVNHNQSKSESKKAEDYKTEITKISDEGQEGKYKRQKLPATEDSEHGKSSSLMADISEQIIKEVIAPKQT